MCLRLLLKAILITSLVVGSVRGQWCHWLRWECQKSAILCRPVRQRACCSAGCSGGSGSEDAVYNSQSLMLDPPFYCDMAANSSSTVCASHFAQYTPSANASLWCAWTYWTAWATVMDSGSAGVCVWKRVRSRQRACECPPPLVTLTNSSNSSSQCDSGSLVGDSDNSTGFATSIGADGVLRLFSTELTDPADGFEAPLSVCSTDGDSTDGGSTDGSSSGGVSSTESSRVSPSWAWVAAVAAVPLALLLVAASVVAGVCLGRLHAKRVRVAAAAAAELSTVAASSTATDSSAASSTAM